VFSGVWAWHWSLPWKTVPLPNQIMQIMNLDRFTQMFSFMNFKSAAVRSFDRQVAINLSSSALKCPVRYILETTTTTTTTVLRPFVRDYPSEPVPEDTLTHPPSWYFRDKNSKIFSPDPLSVRKRKAPHNAQPTLTLIPSSSAVPNLKLYLRHCVCFLWVS